MTEATLTEDRNAWLAENLSAGDIKPLRRITRVEVVAYPFLRLHGFLVDHKPPSWGHTSRIIEWSPELGIAITRNSVYLFTPLSHDL